MKCKSFKHKLFECIILPFWVLIALHSFSRGIYLVLWPFPEFSKRTTNGIIYVAVKEQIVWHLMGSVVKVFLEPPFSRSPLLPLCLHLAPSVEAHLKLIWIDCAGKAVLFLESASLHAKFVAAALSLQQCKLLMRLILLPNNGLQHDAARERHLIRRRKWSLAMREAWEKLLNRFYMLTSEND